MHVQKFFSLLEERDLFNSSSLVRQMRFNVLFFSGHYMYMLLILDRIFAFTVARLGQ